MARARRPSEILALTFTDKAAERCSASDQLGPMYTIGYFHLHAFATGSCESSPWNSAADRHALHHAQVLIFLRERLFEFELDEYGRWAIRRASSAPWPASLSLQGRDQPAVVPGFARSGKGSRGGDGKKARRGRALRERRREVSSPEPRRATRSCSRGRFIDFGTR